MMRATLSSHVVWPTFGVDDFGDEFFIAWDGHMSGIPVTQTADSKSAITTFRASFHLMQYLVALTNRGE